MIIKFSIKERFWIKHALKGPNMFIRDLVSGEYRNHNIGELPKIDEGTEISQKMLDYYIRHKGIIIHSQTEEIDDKQE